MPRRPVGIPRWKYCTKCKDPKPAKAFLVQSDCRALRSMCMECEAAASAHRRAARPKLARAPRAKPVPAIPECDDVGPTAARPGSVDKMAVLRGRAMRRLPLFHPADPRLTFDWRSVVRMAGEGSPCTT